MSSTQMVGLNYTLTYVDESGVVHPIANTPVYVTKQSGSSAQVFSSLSGTLAGSPITTDSSGNLNSPINPLFVYEGSYLINVPTSTSPAYAAFSVYFEAVHGDGIGNISNNIANLNVGTDISGNLNTPSGIKVNSINGNVPVTESTTLSNGVLSGTLPSPRFNISGTAGDGGHGQGSGGWGLLPPGAIIEHAGFVPPVGFLALKTSGYTAPTINTYPNLFSALTYTTSANVSWGNGVTTVTVNDISLKPFCLGITGFVQTSYSNLFIPICGPAGIGSTYGTYVNTITAITFGSSTTTLTLSVPTSAIQSAATICLMPHGTGNGYTVSNPSIATFDLPLAKAGFVGVGVGSQTDVNGVVQPFQLGREPFSGSSTYLGSYTVTLNTSQIAYHTHNYSGTTGADSPDHQHQVYNPGTLFWPSPGYPGGWGLGGFTSGNTVVIAGNIVEQQVNTGFDVESGGASARHAHTYGGTTDGGTGGGQSHSNIQPSLGFNYYIKY